MSAMALYPRNMMQTNIVLVLPELKKAMTNKKIMATVTAMGMDMDMEFLSLKNHLRQRNQMKY